MKNSIFASFGNSIIALQFLNGGKMIKWKNIAVEKYPGWRSLRWRSFPSLCSLNFSYYFSLILLLLQLFLQLTTNNYNKKVVVTTHNLQLQLQLTTWEEYPPGFGSNQCRKIFIRRIDHIICNQPFMHTIEKFNFLFLVLTYQ